MSRNKILSFTTKYYDKHGVSPSIRAISDGVDGVDRKNFYHFFEDKAELLVALGIQEEVTRPEAAMEAKKKATEKGGDYRITLNQAQSEKLLAIAYMEGKPVSMVVDEVLEDQRQVREILLEVNEGRLDGDVIDAILNPDLVYNGWNVSKFAGKPWVMLNCNKCGEDIFVGEDIDLAKWVFEIMPIMKRVFRPNCEDCQHKSYSLIRIPA